MCGRRRGSIAASQPITDPSPLRQTLITGVKSAFVQVIIRIRMKARIKLFAALREMAGESEVELDLPETATVAHVVRELDRRYAGMMTSGVPIMIAVNAEYVSEDHPIQEGDEIAFIPPVSGGGL